MPIELLVLWPGQRKRFAFIPEQLRGERQHRCVKGPLVEQNCFPAFKAEQREGSGLRCGLHILHTKETAERREQE